MDEGNRSLPLQPRSTRAMRVILAAPSFPSSSGGLPGVGHLASGEDRLYLSARRDGMKIAACDFDGTLYRDGAVSADDLAAIAAWRAAATSSAS